jgi:23S rRNA-/tRNA-specific pseudouridylate synthase
MTERKYSLEEGPRIIEADDSIVVAWKPHRMHSTPLVSSDAPDLSSWVLALYPDAVPIHRLDFETAGLMLLARNALIRAALLAAQDEGRIIKTYRLIAAPSMIGLPGSRPLHVAAPGLTIAEWDGLLAAGSLEGLVPHLAGGSIKSRFRPFGPGATRVACLAPDDRRADGREPRRRRGAPPDLYSTRIVTASPDGDRISCEVSIDRGFRHQIRAQFAWLGIPLVGDVLYGGRGAPILNLLASKLEFSHPATGRHTLIEVASDLR